MRAGLAEDAGRSRVAVGSAVAGRDGGTACLTFCDRTEVTVACNAAAESAADRHCGRGMRITGHSPRKKDIPWLKDAAGRKMPVSGPVPRRGAR